MRILHRQLITLAALTTATAIFLNGTQLGLRESKFGMGNGYLSDTNYFGATNSLTGLLFGDKAGWASMSRYLSLSGEYETKKYQGLMNSSLESSYMSQFNALAQSALAGWQGHQMGAATQFFSHTVDDALGLQSLRRQRGAVMYTGLILAAYTGRTLRYKMSGDMSIESRTKMSEAKFDNQYVGWKSHKLEASMGATYSSQSQTSALNIQKKISKEVSLNYEASNQQAIGVSFTRGF